MQFYRLYEICFIFSHLYNKNHFAIISVQHLILDIGLERKLIAANCGLCSLSFTTFVHIQILTLHISIRLGVCAYFHTSAYNVFRSYTPMLCVCMCASYLATGSRMSLYHLKAIVFCRVYMTCTTYMQCMYTTMIPHENKYKLR